MMKNRLCLVLIPLRWSALAIVAMANIAPQTAPAGVLDSFIDQSKLYLTASQDAAEACLQPPGISTDIRKQNPELTANKPKDLGGLRTSEGVLQGLAHMSYGFEISFTLERISTDEGYCVRISEMVVLSGLIKPKIWIKPDLQKGSCTYDTTIDHEMQHVKNYHDHLVRFEAAVKSELPIILKGNAYYQIGSIAEAKRAEKMLESEVVAAVKVLHDHSYDKAAAQDLMMDSPSEYLRLSQHCK